jgi:ubiquinone/menaquinone biosynthesis C-methylase UbiE
MPDMSETSSTELPTVRDFWDAQTPRYDEAVDHGLGDPAAREAWRSRLRGWLPPPPSTVLDLGCGTGSLSLLALEEGHRVHGVDLAPAMVEEARRKCAARDARFDLGDAASPPVEEASVDAVLARHLLWTLPDPHAALATWVRLVRPGGRLVLIEGRWWSAGEVTPYAEGTETLPWQGGVRAEDLTAALDPLVERLEVVCLSGEPALWGRSVDDERYAIVASVPGA